MNVFFLYFGAEGFTGKLLNKMLSAPSLINFRCYNVSNGFIGKFLFFEILPTLLWKLYLPGRLLVGKLYIYQNVWVGYRNFSPSLKAYSMMLMSIWKDLKKWIVPSLYKIFLDCRNINLLLRKSFINKA